ncbi:MAG: universal stress protein [Thermoleophilaceae bacterium]
MAPKIVLAIEPGTAERVARAGGELSAALGARLVLAHVRNDPPLFNSTRERERARNRAMRRGSAVLGRAHAVLPAGVEAEERVELGVAAKRLSEVADEVDAAVMVLDSRGRGPLTAALLLPAYARHAEPDDPAVVRVLVEHVDLRRRAQDLAASPDAAAADLRELGERLERHIRHEERVLSPMVEEALSQAELERLAAAVERADASQE